MLLGKVHRPSKAAAMLVLATCFWGTSFLLMKALGQCQQKMLPNATSWFLSSLSLLVRFSLGTLILLVWNGRSLRQLTRLELVQGVGLGLFGGIGILFQMDGVLHTAASTSAFLTQCYCIFIPIFVALTTRTLPQKTLGLSCLMALAGITTLAHFDWADFHLGRGEAESILASILFTAQILSLERPAFFVNRSSATTLVMFIVTTFVLLPVVLLNTTNGRDWITAYSSVSAVSLVIFLTLACTVFAYVVMNRWQPHLSATHASLIYCSEPVFTSVFVLFIPGMLSVFAGISYANEVITLRRLVGGGLIMAANLLVLWQSVRGRKQILTPQLPERPLANQNA